MQRIIRRIEVPNGRQKLDGLKPTKVPIDRLGKVTIFAGKNGSGKTRLLNAIFSSLERGKEISRRNGETISEYISKIEERLSEFREMVSRQKDAHGEDLRGFDSLSIEKEINQLEGDKAQTLKIEFASGVAVQTCELIFIRPSIDIKFEDPNKVSQEDRKKRLNVAQWNRKFNNQEDTLLIVEKIARDHVISTHPKRELTEGAKGEGAGFEKIVRDLDQLCSAKLEINWSGEFEPVMDGLRLFEGSERLSNGQKRLMQFCANTNENEENNSNFIVFIDEPELFLHPAAVNAMIDRWLSSFKNIQIFIASHSVPLIAHFGFENVWHIEESSITYAGKSAIRVLDGLLGGVDNIERLQNLTLEPSRLATATFAMECLKRPEVLPGSGPDPQARQLIHALERLHDEQARPISVLDFGAGKCRLLDAIRSELGARTSTFIDYVAYDPLADIATETIEKIKSTYNDKKDRIFNKMSKIISNGMSSTFDIVVLCNVLHEIHPSNWIEEVKNIKLLARNEGKVIIIEDQEMPHGELAHKDGFLILERGAIKVLFNLKEGPEEVRPVENRYKERLTAYIINIKDIEICQKSVKDAVSWTRDQSFRKIREARSEKNEEYKTGMIYALICQQYMNAEMYLKSID